MNLAGGIGFLVALWCCALTVGTLLVLRVPAVIGQNNPALTTLAVTALAFAGITKAAQMPFQTWLLGAMVAPTPTSALLHSSTMVKAGVFLLVKLAPVFHVSPAPAVMVMLVGGITFALCSFMAISQSNAKRVLAYSTIANLGLITACAGVGTAEAVWAACFLILFHAIAKSLLFLCVGTAEHHIGSRDIESMDLLFDRMPRLARFMMLGIMCMFIAPFGMLLAKWATLVSFVDTRQVALIIILAFGSAATFMFWAKWLGQALRHRRRAGERGGHGEADGMGGAAAYGLPARAGLRVPAAHLRRRSSSPTWPASTACSARTSPRTTCGSPPSAPLSWWPCCSPASDRKQKSRRANVYLAGISRDNDSRAFQNSLSGDH